MEYIKKEELKDNDIFISQMSHNHFLNKYGTGFSLHLNLDNTIKDKVLYRNSGFAYSNMRLATPEEKHWLNECIKLDKFITFEEAMKTFIPEYVECSDSTGWKQTIRENGGNLIFKSDFKSNCKRQIIDSLKDKSTIFKPSTKEAYDAQFAVKEPEFVLPEKWCIKVTNENRDIINNFRKKGLYNTCSIPIDYNYMTSVHNAGNYKVWNTEITFEQFKKYVLKEEIVEEKVIEPLPQFKIIETIETITKVENNEGNQFFIGDIVKSDSGIVQTIKSFRYNVNKDNVLATTNVCNQISINRLEHYIEPKVEKPIIIAESVKDMLDLKSKGIDTIVLSPESLLEKAKRLYPVGTKFKSVNSGKIFTIKNHIQEECYNLRTIVFGTNELNGSNNFYACVHSKDNIWAEIIEYSHGFKIGDKIKSKYGNTIYSINKIEGNQLFFETDDLPKINSILAKNAIKVN